VLAASGCEAAAPAEPTWAQDVKPILVANCAPCHLVPSQGGAPSSFRLDVYGPSLTDDDRVIHGADTMAPFIAARVLDESMPPRAALSERQKQVLETWADLVGPLGAPPPRGGPAADNHPPRFVLPDPLGDGTVSDYAELRYEITDDDFDSVIGRMEAAGPGGITVITRELHSGRGVAMWDVAAAQDGRFELSVVIDDGSGERVVELGPFDVGHADGNHAPTVRLVNLVGDEILRDDTSPFDIEIAIGDPDVGDTLTITVEAVLGDRVTVLARDVPAVRDDGPGEPEPNRIAVDTRDLEASANWRFRVTASDGAYRRVVTSPPVIVSHTATALRFDDVGPIVSEHCGLCHRGSSSRLTVPNLPLDLTSYDELARRPGLVWRRVVQKTEMPPASAAILDARDAMPRAARDALGEWLLGGAPR
jgi:hypothetical protein